MKSVFAHTKPVSVWKNWLVGRKSEISENFRITRNSEKNYEILKPVKGIKVLEKMRQDYASLSFGKNFDEQYLGKFKKILNNI